MPVIALLFLTVTNFMSAGFLLALDNGTVGNIVAIGNLIVGALAVYLTFRKGREHAGAENPPDN